MVDKETNFIDCNEMFTDLVDQVQKKKGICFYLHIFHIQFFPPSMLIELSGTNIML